jgi:hypothetical protein
MSDVIEIYSGQTIEVVGSNAYEVTVNMETFELVFIDQPIEITTDPYRIDLTLAGIGPQGEQGTQGVQGIQGIAGPQNLFVGGAQPIPAVGEKVVWVKDDVDPPTLWEVIG